MINLLPPKEKDFLSLTRIKNMAIVLGIIAIAFLICLILILFSLKFYVLSEADVQKLLLESTQEKYYQLPDIGNLKNAIQKYNEFLPKLNSFYKQQIRFSDALALISEIEKPEGLYFTNIILNQKDNHIKIEISGASSTREDLIFFQKRLEEQIMIKNVSFSPGSWVSPAKSNFDLTLEYGT